MVLFASQLATCYYLCISAVIGETRVRTGAAIQLMPVRITGPVNTGHGERLRPPHYAHAVVRPVQEITHFCMKMLRLSADIPRG